MSTKVMAQCWPVQVNAAQKSVLISLADQANDDGLCWPSISTMAERCCLGERTVQRALKSLEDLGHISRRERFGRSTYYYLHPRHCDTPVRAAPPSERHPTPATETPPPPSERHPEPSVEPSGNRKGRRANRATHLPEDWSLPDAWRQEAEALAQKMGISVDVDLEADKFRDYWHSASGQKARKANWLATWRNWIRNKKEFGGRSQPPAPQQQVINDGY